MRPRLITGVSLDPGYQPLSQISFGVARGEICAFLGPNEAGKTTCMNILIHGVHKKTGLIGDFLKATAPSAVRN